MNVGFRKTLRQVSPDDREAINQIIDQIISMQEDIEENNREVSSFMQKGSYGGSSSGGYGVLSSTFTIATGDWSGSPLTCTKSVDGVTSDNAVIVDSSDAKVSCTGQGDGTLTFTATSTPSSATTIKVVVFP